MGAIISIMALNELREKDESLWIGIIFGLLGHWFVVFAMIGALLGYTIKKIGGNNDG